MSVSKTTKATTRHSPASDIAPSKAEARKQGPRRYLTKKCPECWHRIRLLPGGQCERCLIVSTLEDGKTARERERARNLLKASRRGPAAYVVDPYALSIRRKAEEAEWQRELVQLKEKAQAGVGLFYAALEDGPELLRRACMIVPGASHPWGYGRAKRLQQVHSWADLGRYVPTNLEAAVDAHRAGDPVGTAMVRFLSGIDWQDHWITPRQYREARERATVSREDHDEWIEARSGVEVPGPGWAFERYHYRDDADRELVAQFKRERNERLELLDAVYRADLRRWERAVDTLERDSCEYGLALAMKPRAPEGYHGRRERRRALKHLPAAVRKAQAQALASR